MRYGWAFIVSITLSGLAWLVPGARGADVYTAAQPTYDRWMYPFNASSPPGSRPYAPSFGAFDQSFDERDGQFYFAFVVSNAIPAGLGADSYEVVSLTLRASVDGETFLYDPTFDSYVTHMATNHPQYQPDVDVGRPLELFGAAFRGVHNGFSFGENGPFASAPGYKGSRTVYPLGFREGALVDASNHVDPDGTGTNGFDPESFALGQAPLPAGSLVPSGTEFEFVVNVSHPEIQAYLQDGCDQGILGFVIATLHAASFGGDVTYPNWVNKENVVGTPARLEMEYNVHPPVTVGLATNQVVVCWPSAATGFHAQVSTALGVEGSWEALSNVVEQQDGQYRVVAPDHEDLLFFRLVNP